MESKVINIKVVVDGQTDVKQLEKDVNKVVASAKKLETQSKKTGKVTADNLTEASDAADNLSGGVGGVVEQFNVVSKAAKKGGSAMRTALISTGVGALVVALGLIVENWRSISVYLGFINEDLEKQQNLIESNLSNLDFELKLLEAQEKILKEQGKSTVAIKEEQKKIILLQQEQNPKLLLENLELQLEKEKAQIREVTQWEKIKIAALKAAGAYDLAAKEIAKSVVGGDDDRERLAALTKQLQEGQLRAEKLKLALLTVDNPDSNTGGKSKRAKQVSVSDGLLSNEEQTEKLSRLSKQFEEVFKS